MPGRTITLTWEHEPRLSAPAKYGKACRYQAYIPDPLRTLDLSVSAEAAGIAAEADAAIRELNADARPALAPLARLLLRTESIASSKVEGMQLSARDLARAEARMEGGSKVGSTAVEVMGNVYAMELAIDEAAAKSDFTPDELLAIHRKLMERAPNARIAGRFRTVQNWIGGNDYNPCGADFVPPPPEHVEPLIEDLCAYTNDDLHPPLVQAALAHAQFETIHPFDDGNGRTGRALIHVILRRRGVAPSYVPPISVVLASSRDRYIDGLTKYRKDEIDSWLEHFAGAADLSARLAADYLEAVHQLTDEWRAQLKASSDAPRADAAAWAVIDQLPGHPIITAPVAAAASGRSKPAVYQALSQLEEAGILIPLSTSRRNQSWEAVGLLDLLAGLEAAERPALSR
jgi:Fic family protein